SLANFTYSRDAAIRTMMKETIISTAIHNQIHHGLNTKVRNTQPATKILVEAKAGFLVDTMAVVAADTKQHLVFNRIEQLNKIIVLLLWAHELRINISLAGFRHALTSITHVYDPGIRSFFILSRCSLINLMSHWAAPMCIQTKG